MLGTIPEWVEYLAASVKINKKQAKAVMENIERGVAEALASGAKVRLPGVGGLRVVRRGPRPGRNPKTGEVVSIAPTARVQFRVADPLKRSVAALPVEEPGRG